MQGTIPRCPACALPIRCSCRIGVPRAPAAEVGTAVTALLQLIRVLVLSQVTHVVPANARDPCRVATVPIFGFLAERHPSQTRHA